MNDRINDRRCVATTHVSRLRENAALAKREKRMTGKSRVAVLGVRRSECPHSAVRLERRFRPIPDEVGGSCSTGIECAKVQLS